jgi:hypothetical protein
MEALGAARGTGDRYSRPSLMQAHGFRACGADRAALGRMCRPKPAKLARCERLPRRGGGQARAALVAQISGWLVGSFPDEAEMRVSHGTIYLSLFVQARDALLKGLTRCLRRGHATRRPLAAKGSHVDVRRWAGSGRWQSRR